MKMSIIIPQTIWTNLLMLVFITTLIIDYFCRHNPFSSKSKIISKRIKKQADESHISGRLKITLANHTSLNNLWMNTLEADWRRIYWLCALSFFFFSLSMTVNVILFIVFLILWFQRVNQQRILPPLFKECVNPDMIPFVLPSILYVAEQSTDKEYVSIIFPELIPMFKLQKPVQVSFSL